MLFTVHMRATWLVVLVMVAWPASAARVQIGGDGVAEFLDRVEAYAALHRRLEAPLPPLLPADDPGIIAQRRWQLAAAILKARPDAREGDVFTPGAAALRRLVAETLTPRDITLLHEESWPAHDPVVNAPLPAGASHAVPPLLLFRLPPLPEDVEYRIVNADLVLWDIHADLVIDVLRDVFVVPAYV